MNTSLYVHIPFCKHRCHYCDFNTYTGKEDLIPAYIDALIEEFRIVSYHLPDIQLHSIYFGGGTPSLISIVYYEKLINAVNHYFPMVDDCEISLEANPGTVNPVYLSQMRKLGFNRISMGVQSTDSFDLARLDRIHSIDDILNAMYSARQAGFENISLDMIFNLPWQDLSSWEHSLSRAIDLAPEHFSLYGLIIEPGTLFSDWYQKGLIAPQNEDLEADMFEQAIDMLEKAGYVHYEISNWAKKSTQIDFRCRHNLQYWLNLPYIGVGAGAHGYLGGIRAENVPGISEYIQCMKEGRKKPWGFPETPATIQSYEIDQPTQMQDFMWLGLRLVNEGVSDDRFQRAYGCSMREVFKEEIEELISLGLVVWGDNNSVSLKLTQRGLLLANQVFMRFV